MNPIVNTALPVFRSLAASVEHIIPTSLRVEPAASLALPKNTLAIVLAVLAAVMVVYIVSRQLKWWKDFLGDMTDFFTGQSLTNEKPAVPQNKPDEPDRR